MKCVAKKLIQLYVITQNIIMSYNRLYKTITLHISNVTNLNNFHKQHFYLCSVAEGKQHNPIFPCLHHFHYVSYYHPCNNCEVFLHHTNTNVSSKHFIGIHSGRASTSCSSMRTLLCMCWQCPLLPHTNLILHKCFEKYIIICSA